MKRFFVLAALASACIVQALYAAPLHPAARKDDIVQKCMMRKVVPAADQGLASIDGPYIGIVFRFSAAESGALVDIYDPNGLIGGKAVQQLQFDSISGSFSFVAGQNDQETIVFLAQKDQPSQLNAVAMIWRNQPSVSKAMNSKALPALMGSCVVGGPSGRADSAFNDGKIFVDDLSRYAQ